MTRTIGLTLLWLLLFVSTAVAQKAPEERRLLRIESRLYGWYGVAEPEFDKTIGRRELFKINAADGFLQGLDGRLVILQGHFSSGQLNLGKLAPPPVSVPEGSRRQRFTIDGAQSAAGILVTTDGYRLQDGPAELLSAGHADLVVAPVGEQQLRVVGLLKVEAVSEPAAVAPPISSPNAPVTRPTPAPLSLPSAKTALPTTAASGALLELEMSQDVLDAVVELGREQAGLKAGFQGVTLEASHLRVILPDGMSSPEAAWRLEGTVELSYLGTGSLAESSFVISARPSIAGNVLRLAPNWEEIKLEGQLPFGFSLDAKMLGQLTAYLPQQLPIVNLDWISSYLRSQGLLEAEDQVDWFLGSSGESTLRLGLGPAGSAATLTNSSRRLAPGHLRLQLAAPVADRLVRRGVQSFLSPDTPFVPDPPITVGKVLFVAIKVEQVFLRSLQSGYSQGVFRFRDLVVDVAWKAGPLSGVEPLLSATGYISPRLTRGADGVRYWDWDTKIEHLVIRSDKMPGNKESLAAELIPRLEKELGSELAQKQKLPARLPLSALVSNSRSTASLELTELRPLDAYLELEGRLVR